VTIRPQAVALTKELPGRTSAVRVAEVRARVSGIVLRRSFEEGSAVRQGQLLFQIDPAPYAAARDAAAAQVARAESNVAAARSLAERYGRLIEAAAISRQELDDATFRLRAAEAEVAAARAALRTAQISLDYTSVVAPIAGRVGRAAVTEGAYVQQGAATLMATIQQLDSVYVDLTVSSVEHARMRRALATGALAATPGEAKIAVVLEDGRVLPELGTLQFADVTVDPATGSIALRALVPNPRAELLPGMFVRARIDEGTDPAAILLTQRAVSRDQAGKPTALVVGADRKAELRPLVAERAIGSSWLVTAGLAPGDQVIVEGLQRVRPGSAVAPSPAVEVPGGAGSGSAAPPAPSGGSAGAATATGSARAPEVAPAAAAGAGR
jgi:membrane fusion protein (multidrug efflux system)